MTTPLISAGSIVAGYRIESVAGQGGMGVVYRATQLALGRPVALKLIATELAHDVSFRQRFQRESQIAASIDHPNVIPVYEAGEADGSLFLAMRYVDGTDLAALVGREERLAPARAVRILAQIAAGLDAAHRRGLVHRDVKPANVLLADEDEHVYLTDFGLTKRTTSRAALTRTGMFVGTLDYCAPEQIRGEPSDGRADIYALGCVLFRCLAGEAPYERDSDVAKMYAHLNDPVPSASTLVSDVPAALDQVIARALAKEPAERYATAGEFARAALTAVSDPPPAPAAAPAPLAPLTPAPAPVVPAAAPVAPSSGSNGKPPEDDSTVEDEEPLPWPQRHRKLVGGTLGTVFAAGLAAAVLAASGVLGGGDGAADKGATAAARPTATATATPAATAAPAQSQATAVATIDVGKGPDGIAVDEKGVVWVNNHDGGTVSRIDGDSGKVLGKPFKVGKNVDGIVTGGGITYTAVAGEDRVQRFEGADEPIVGASVDVGDDPEGIALGKQLVWVANRGSNSVNRLDRATPTRLGPPIGVGSQPTGIFVGRSTVWVTNNGDNSVTRIDPSTATIKGQPITVGDAPRGVKEGFKFAWVANSGDNTVTKLDRDTGRPIGQPIEVGHNPREIAIGLGSVWVTNRDDGTVTRIEPKTGRVIGNAITVGSRPLGIAVGGGAVWVSNHGGDSVTKIQP